jgi:hypothetical protein
MKKTYLVLLVILFANLNVKAQVEPYLSGYKTFDDFFANKKVLVGKWIELSSDRKFKCVDTVTQKKFKVNMKELNFIGYTYGFKNQKFIYDSIKDTYYNFICGNRGLLVIFTCCIASGSFDANGNLLSATFMSDEGSNFYFVKNLDFKNRKKDFEEIIKDKPKIYQQYLDEKNADKKVWGRNHITYYEKYITLYDAEK